MNNKHPNISYKDNQFRISGNINFSNVMGLYQKSMFLLHQYPCNVFDFSDLGACDSSAVALIIEWMKWAKKNNTTLELKNIPEKLIHLSKIAGAEMLFKESG